RAGPEWVVVTLLAAETDAGELRRTQEDAADVLDRLVVVGLDVDDIAVARLDLRAVEPHFAQRRRLVVRVAGDDLQHGRSRNPARTEVQGGRVAGVVAEGHEVHAPRPLFGVLRNVDMANETARHRAVRLAGEALQ